MQNEEEKEFQESQGFFEKPCEEPEEFQAELDEYMVIQDNSPGVFMNRFSVFFRMLAEEIEFAFEKPHPVEFFQDSCRFWGMNDNNFRIINDFADILNSK